MAEQARGDAFSGNGYGTRRRMLYESARDQIERSIQSGIYGEAMALCESILADRLESRLSFLRNKNCVAELNPQHHDRVLPTPKRAIDVVRTDLDSLKGEADDEF